jgi:hypothetical protein
VQCCCEDHTLACRGHSEMTARFPNIVDINVAACLRNYHLNPRLGACRAVLPRCALSRCGGPPARRDVLWWSGAHAAVAVAPLLTLPDHCVRACRLQHDFWCERPPGHPRQRQGAQPRCHFERRRTRHCHGTPCCCCAGAALRRDCEYHARRR